MLERDEEREDADNIDAWTKATSKDKEAAREELLSIMHEADERRTEVDRPKETEFHLPIEQLLLDVKGYEERYFILIDHIGHLLEDVKAQNLTAAEKSNYRPLIKAKNEATKIRMAFRGATVDLNRSVDTRNALEKVLNTPIPE